MHVNTVSSQIDERVVGNESSASIEVVADPIFDLTTLIGKVWVDQNENGIQDKEEVGIAGARIGTVRGEWITTDQFGRFSLPGVDPGRNAWGRNAILKLDTASLPSGALLTTPNPLVRRITGGLMQQFDFGVRLPDVETPVKQSYEVVTKRATRVEGFIDPVRFESGQFEISPRYLEILRAAITSLGVTNNLRVIVEGHTDSEPLSARLASRYKDNYGLSEHRASEVAGFLKAELKLADENFIIRGYGPDRPTASNGSPEGMSLNRRVEIALTYDEEVTEVTDRLLAQKVSLTVGNAYFDGGGLSAKGRHFIDQVVLC